MGQHKHKIQRHLRRAGVSLVVIAMLALVVWVPGASAQVEWRDAVFSGAAAGSTLHADAIQAGTTRLVNVDEAFSAATVNSQNLSQAYQTEMQTIVQPSLPDKKSFARGSALEIDPNSTVPATAAPEILLGGRADASAPPTMGLQTRELLNQRVAPIFSAAILRGQASAQWDDNNCPIGSDISFGRGFAADVELIETAANAPVISTEASNPERNAAWTITRTRLVPQVNKDGVVVGENWGLMTEVHQTYAPITLLRGTPNQTTIEILGEWVLRVVALGVEGSYFHYGPRNASPETPVVRIINAAGVVTQQITTQQIPLFGPQGFTQTLPIGQIAIGEDPRAIATPPGATPNPASQPTVTPTEVSAAVDVVRLITEIPGVLQIEDLRIGHMEARATVPEGGIICGLSVTKDSNPQQVNAGDEFTYTITIGNPFDCTLTNVRLVDTITVTRGVRYTILGQDPPADEVANGVLTWNNLGDIPPKGSKQVTIRIVVDRRSAAGLFTDNAVATALCGTADAQGRTGIGTAVRGETTIQLPRVGRLTLPATGGPTNLMAVLGASLIGGSMLILSRRRLAAVRGRIR